MNELELALIGDSAAAPPAHILEGLDPDLVHRNLPGVPHTIYQELWHIVFWQQVTLEWIDSKETPFPAEPAVGFGSQVPVERESWQQLCRRFLDGSSKAAAITHDAAKLEQIVRCPARPGKPARLMSVREQLESLAAHNAYHFGRIVLLRQLHGSWPPPSGGFNW